MKKQKIYLLSKDFKMIKEYDSVTEAAKDKNVSQSCINKKILNFDKLPRNDISEYYIRKQDYEKYKDNLKELLTENTYLAIYNGRIEYVEDTFRTMLLKHFDNYSSNSRKYIDTQDKYKFVYDKDNKRYIIIRKKDYIDIIKDDILYFHKPIMHKNIKPVKLIDKYTGEELYFMSLSKAADFLKCSKENVRMAIKIEYEIKNQYIARYIDNEEYREAAFKKNIG